MEKLCRICFKLAEDVCLVIDEVTKQLFSVLLLRMNWNFAENPIMCVDCAKIAKKSCYFKLACIQTEKSVLSFAVAKTEAKFDMRYIYGCKQTVKSIVDGNYGICRFCMNLSAEESNFMSIDNLRGGTTFEEMLQVFMPEVDLTIIENTIICAQCKDNLECYLNLVDICADTENKICSYSLDKLSNSKGREKLGNVLKHFSFNDIKPQESLERYLCLSCPYETTYRENLMNHMQIHKIASEPMYECTKCDYWTICRRNFKRHTRLHEEYPGQQMYKCAQCPHITTLKGSLKIHMLVHRSKSEVKTYKCSKCMLNTKYISSYKKHMLTHRGTSKVRYNR